MPTDKQTVVPTYECDFRIGQAVHLAKPYAEDDPSKVYFVTGIDWEYRSVAHRGWNITIAPAEDINRGYGATDGFSPSDLTAAEQAQEAQPVAHAYVVDGQCEQIDWGIEYDLPLDPSLVPLYTSPTIPEGWQPIETAPKDGRHVLVRLINGEVFRASFHRSGWWVATDLGHVNAKHWMPLPAAPKPEDNK